MGHIMKGQTCRAIALWTRDAFSLGGGATGRESKKTRTHLLRNAVVPGGVSVYADPDADITLAVTTKNGCSGAPLAAILQWQRAALRATKLAQVKLPQKSLRSPLRVRRLAFTYSIA